MLGAAILVAAFVFGWLRWASSRRLPEYGAVQNLSLTERNGRGLSLAELSGRVWIADFIFTRCQTVCPFMSQAMSELQKNLPLEITLVSFSVDPEYDTPKRLSRYAKSLGADEGRWLFLTGGKKAIWELTAKSFHLTAAEAPKGAIDPIMHSTQFALVDQEGKIRGYYDATDSGDFERLKKNALSLMKSTPGWVKKLPKANACLNATSALLLLFGFFFIKRRNVPAHKTCMGLAFLASALFLTFYLTYHYYAGSKPFEGTGWIRPVYFFILTSHTILAALILPLALVTLYFAWKENFSRHTKIARVTFPLWLYVSLTGIAVYWMLYTR